MAFLSKINDVSGGDITSIVSSTGLSGGATSGVVTLSVDAAQTGITSLGTQTANFSVENGYGIIIGTTGVQETVSIGDGATDLVPELQVLGTAAADASMLLAAFSTTATTAGSPIIALAKGGHGTLGSHTIVTDGEELGNIIAFGDDGNDLETPAASIQFEVDGTPGANDMPGRILFNTTADGATALTERIRIDKTGAIGIAGANYGTDGQVLTSGGAGAAVAWEDASGGGGNDHDGDTTIANGYGLVVGHTAIVTHDAAGAAEFQVIGTGALDSHMLLANYQNSAQAPQFSFSKSRGALGASADAANGVDSGDGLGSIFWYADDQTNIGSWAARISVVAAADATENDVPAYMNFWTNAGAGGATERMRIGSDGLVTLPDAGGLVVGHTAQLAAGEATAETQIVGTVTNGDGALLIYVANTTNTHTPSIRFVKNANATIGTNSTAVADDEEIVVIRGYGTDGTDADTLIGELRLEVDDGSPGTGAIGGAWVALTAATDGTRTEAVRIDSSQNTTFAGNAILSDAANVSISTPLLAGADHTTTGLTAEMLAGGAIAAFDLVCIHTTTQEVVEADASNLATTRVIGIAPAAISDTATGTILLHGFIRDDSWNWTTGATLYLSETAGAMTETAPTTSGAFVKVVGIALEPDVVYINPDNSWIEIA